jgi:stress response protein YsnF
MIKLFSITIFFYNLEQRQFKILRNPIKTFVMTEDQQAQIEAQKAVQQLYNHASDLIVNQKRRSLEVINILVKKGIDEESAKKMVQQIKRKLDLAKEAQNEEASKNMAWGAVWCIGGIVATVANLGYVFWGAIIFGAIQFFQGLASRTD